MVLKGVVFVVLVNVIFVSGKSKDSSHLVDYDPNYIRQRRQTDKKGCTLPSHPQHGSWNILNGKGNPGDEVPIGSVIIFECKPGYKLSNKIPSVCLGEWSLPVPTCDKACPPLYPSNTYDLTCIDKLGKEISCAEATHGTNLEYTCKTFYETPFGYKKTLFCEDGKWDNQKPVCQPVCGKKIDHDKRPLIYGAEPNEKITHPWVAAVYKKINDSYENVCGASILSQRVVVTAAHCVTNSYGDVLPKEEYMVGVGKLYRKYKAAEDKHAQYLELLQIEVPEGYKGDTRKFAADIAVLVVKAEMSLTEVAQPVCFTNLRNIHLHAGNRGEVSGWGVTQGGNVSEVLRTLVIPYKHETVCADELPSEWADKYNLRDKICAGFVNKSTSVCTGDSGSGLAFKYREDNRYYIHGVVSLGHQVEYMCDIQQNSLYTSVAAYYDFVDRLLTKYAAEVRDCILPPHPQDGKWTTDPPKWKPGDSVPSSTVLKVECDGGFQISSGRNFECSSAHNLPTCEKLCPRLQFPSGTNYTCQSKEGQYIDCSTAIDGSTLWYDCPYLHDEANYVNNTICVKGSWAEPVPECIPRCGRKVVGESGVGSETPWNVAIYKKNYSGKEKYKMICSGSLVSVDVIVTAAQCVTNRSGHLLPRENFLVGAGKLYKQYDDPRDTHAEFVNVSYIIVEPEYESAFDQSPNVSLNNVAILKTLSHLKWNNFVQPICVIGRYDYWLANEVSGLIAGRTLSESDAPKTITAIEMVRDPKRLLCDIADELLWYFFGVFDKECTGFKNESACLLPEDLGKGISAKNPVNGRYYLYTVVGFHTLTGCQKRQFPATKINSYVNIIRSVSSSFDNFSL